MNDIMTVRLHEVGKVSAVVKDAVVVEKDVPGVGVPPGGASGQVLTKLSGADYDTGWRAAIGGGENDHSKLTNRDAKDQHPMGAIAGLAEALDGKQPKGDYLTADKLQSATDAALAQAKASGVFDGVPGVPGAKGDKGDTGPAGPQGPAGAPGKDAATDISLGITGATVGQIVKIAAVGTDGKPTAWSPADLPSGGGGETWELIKAITIADDAGESNALTISMDESGAAFSLKKAKIFGIFPAYKGESTRPNFSFFMLNGVSGGKNAPYCYTSGWESVADNVAKSCSVEVDLTMPGLQAETVWRSNKTSNDYFGPAKIESITSIGGAGMLIYPGCQFWLYGVRKEGTA